MRNLFLFTFIYLVTSCNGNSFDNSVDSSQYISEEFNYNVIGPKLDNETNKEDQYRDSPLCFMNDVLKLRLIDYAGNWSETVDFNSLKLIESDNDWNYSKEKIYSRGFWS